METKDLFETRCYEITGHNLSLIPKGTREDALSYIVARNGGNLLLVYVGPALRDFIDGCDRPANEFRLVSL